MPLKKNLKSWLATQFTTDSTAALTFEIFFGDDCCEVSSWLAQYMD